jgi:hypothetical protein
LNFISLKKPVHGIQFPRTWYVKDLKLLKIAIRVTRTFVKLSCKQCCDSVTFWYVSGSADPCHWLTDSEPALSSVADEKAKKFVFFRSCFNYYFLKVHLHQSSKIKKSKRSRIITVEIRTDNDGSGKTYWSFGSGSTALLVRQLPYFTILIP